MKHTSEYTDTDMIPCCNRSSDVILLFLLVSSDIRASINASNFTLAAPLLVLSIAVNVPNVDLLCLFEDVPLPADAFVPTDLEDTYDDVEISKGAPRCPGV